MAKLFYTNDVFYLRISMLPYKEYEHIRHLQDSDIEQALKIFDENSFLREAILVASPSLYYALLSRPLKNAKHDVRKLIFFLIRMLNRATPYGMFSCVTYGTWGKETHLDFDMRQVNKQARLDMEWLYLFLSENYNYLDNIKNLTVYANPLLQDAVGRIHLEFRLYESENMAAEKEAKQTLSIQKNPLIEKIILLSNKPISVLMLIQALSKCFSTLDELRTLHLIQKLILNQILLGTNLPLLTYKTDLHEHIVKRSPQKEEYEKYANIIADYGALPLGQGERYLDETYKKLTQRVNKKNIVQVDLVSSEGKIALTQNVKHELTDAVETLWIVTQLTSSYHGLDKYHSSFIEKYGKERLVPLKELTNSISGLGHFNQSEYLYSPTNHKTPVMEKWENWLSLMVDESIVNQLQPVQLDKKTITQMIGEDESFYKDKFRALNSFDVFFKIKSSNQDEINKGNYSLFVFQTTQQGCASIQRFTPYFEKNIVDNVKEQLSHEASLEKESIFCSISFWPDKIRNANVVIHPQMREHILSLQHDSNYEGYTLDDIYIASDGHRFYACTQDGRELNICFDTLLNLDYAPLEVKFLHRIRLQKYLSTYAFTFPESFKNRTFLPRVVYNKTILHKARWRLYNKNFISMPFDQVLTEFDSWAKKWHLPRLVEVGLPENSLLLNLDNSCHFNEIVRWLKNGEELFFSESFECDVLKSNEQSFCSEFVAPFIKNIAFCQKKEEKKFPAFIKIPLENEKFFFYDKKWFFIKCYLPYEHMDYFLTEKIEYLAIELSQKYNINDIFFIRYNDTKPHIRLRIKLNNDISFDNLFNFLTLFFNECIKCNYLHDITISTYEREIFRYGGIENMEYIENIFCADSKFIINTIAVYHSLGKNQRMMLFTASAYFFLSKIILNKEDLLVFAKGIKATKINHASHDDNIKKITEMIGKANDVKTDNGIYDIFVKNAENYYNSLREDIIYISKNLDKKNFLDIMYSLLHMHCNRLGCNLYEEKIVTSQLRQIILKFVHSKYI